MPIPYREIVLTAKIMDDIFAQVMPHDAPVTFDVPAQTR